MLTSGLPLQARLHKGSKLRQTILLRQVHGFERSHGRMREAKLFLGHFYREPDSQSSTRFDERFQH